MKKNALIVAICGMIVICVGGGFSLWWKTGSGSVSQKQPPVATEPTYATTSGKLPQFVVLSFDGSKSLEMWEATRAFAREMNQEKKPLHFTYFISGVYFLAPQFSSLYHPPQNPVGFSPIGYSNSAEDVRKRVAEMNAAFAEGHDIASHANGHFGGFPWRKSDWESELAQFSHFVFDWQKNNHLDGSEGESSASKSQPELKPSDIVGFRAPLLSKNDSLYEVLREKGYLYDSSGVAPATDAWPVKDANGIWKIPMAEIPLSGTRTRIIAMDYNFYSTQTHVKDIARHGTPLWEQLRTQMLKSYEDDFNANYTGNRAPVVIGHHFSTWNDGVYWQVMQDFAREECGKPEVYCVSFKDLTQWLEKNPPAQSGQ
jgi:hypothetical protein